MCLKTSLLNQCHILSHSIPLPAHKLQKESDDKKPANWQVHFNWDNFQLCLTLKTHAITFQHALTEQSKVYHGQVRMSTCYFVTLSRSDVISLYRVCIYGIKIKHNILTGLSLAVVFLPCTKIASISLALFAEKNDPIVADNSEGEKGGGRNPVFLPFCILRITETEHWEQGDLKSEYAEGKTTQLKNTGWDLINAAKTIAVQTGRQTREWMHVKMSGFFLCFCPS